MKKLLLTLAASAVVFGANAEKALIISDGAQVFYTGEMPAATVVVPIGFDAKNDGGTLVCDAGQLKWTDPSSFACRNGAIRWAANKEAVFTPTEGITITKITTRSPLAKENIAFGDGWKKDDATFTCTYVPEDGTKAVTMKPTAQNRMNWIEIEYTGTPTQVLPAIGTSFQLAQPGELIVACATDGATIHYTIDRSEPKADSPVAADGKIVLTKDALVKTIAVKDGMKNSFVYQQPVMVPKAGSTICTFNTWNLKSMHYLKDNALTEVTADLFEEDGNNKQWNLGPCSTGETKDAPIVDFVSDNAKLYFFGGNSANPRYYNSAAFGDNYEIRIYANTTVNFEAPEGKVITDVMFNGVDFGSDIVLGYSVKETVDDAEKYVVKTEGVKGTLTQSPIYSKWSCHFVAPEGGLKKVQIADKNGTKYLNNFFICLADGTPDDSAVTEIESADTDAPVEYYNLQGIRVANPENGLYIVKQGNKVSKRIIR